MPPFPTRYSVTAMTLHWLAVLLILATFPVGLYMVELPLSPWKLKVYSWHKWIGVTVFLLALARLTWRMGHPAPTLPDGMRAWEKPLAGAIQALLYLLMLAIPLSGWLMSSAAGFQTVYLGLLPIPDLLAKDKELADFLRWVHQYLTFWLGALAGLHAAAAFKHLWIDRDGVMQRMLPRWERPS